MKRILMVFLGLLSGGPGCHDGPSGASYPVTGITAKERLADVEALAQSMCASAKLMSVRGKDIATDGTAQEWRYMFIDTETPGPMYWFHATSGTVEFDSTAPVMPGPAVISHAWFDSDVALDLAEVKGGAAFRSQKGEWTIEASLGEPVVPNSTTYWWIGYRSSDGGTLWLTLDAAAAPIVVW